MNKPYGLSGFLVGLVDDVSDTIVCGSITIEIHGRVMSVGYEAGTDEAEARRLAQHYVDSYILSHGYRISIALDHSWQPGNVAGTIDHSIRGYASVPVSARGRFVVTRNGEVLQDSASFVNESDIVNKALSDPVLAEALDYYSSEVVGSDNPLYGIYKALEAITEHLQRQTGRDGRAELARLAVQNKSYVADVMETTQVQRHARTRSRRKMSDEECRARAAELIQAYARSL